MFRTLCLMGATGIREDTHVLMDLLNSTTGIFTLHTMKRTEPAHWPSDLAIPESAILSLQLSEQESFVSKHGQRSANCGWLFNFLCASICDSSKVVQVLELPSSKSSDSPDQESADQESADAADPSNSGCLPHIANSSS